MSGFHYTVIQVSNYTSGFAMERVTARVNAFFAANGPFTQTHSRWANFSLESPGSVVALNGNNFIITDCDLYGSYNVLQSMASNTKTGCVATSWPNSCHGATYGYIARNAIWNGGASHFMNQWRQVRAWGGGALCSISMA